MVVNIFKQTDMDSYVIREFDSNINLDSLVWHRDREDRLVEVIGTSDWKFQMDNELPIDFNSKIFIPKNTYHRIIKGTGNLKLKITFLD